MAKKLTEDEILAYTLLGEASGEGPEGMAAVMYVIKNRGDSGSYGSNLAAIALQKDSKGTYQFSTWGEATPPSKKPFTQAEVKQALAVVKAVKENAIPDPTGGAQNYYANKGRNAIAQPWWFSKAASASRTQIGNHIFAGKTALDPAAKENFSAKLSAAMQGTAYPASMSPTTSQKRTASRIDYLPGNPEALALGARPATVPNIDTLVKQSAALRNSDGSYSIIVSRDSLGNDTYEVPYKGTGAPTEAQRRQAIIDYSTKATAKPAWGAERPTVRGVDTGLRPATKVKTISVDPLTGLPTTADKAEAAKAELRARIARAANPAAMTASDAAARNDARAISSANRGNVGAGAVGSGVNTQRVGTPPPAGVYPGSEAYKRWEAQLLQSGGVPQHIPSTVEPGRVNAPTTVVRKDGSSSTSDQPGSVKLPDSARPSVLPKLPVPAVVKPTGSIQPSWTTKLVTKTITVKNPAYKPGSVNPVAVNKLQDIHDREDARIMAAQTPSLVPTVPEFIEQQIVVEERVPVLVKPKAAVPVAAPVAPATQVSQSISKNPYASPAYKQTQGYKDAYASSSGNVSGVSQFGRFYDLDRNEWVDTTKKNNSPSGNRTYAMGAS